MRLCRESRNLSDLCVDPLPCDRGVCGAHDPGSHRSSRLGRRSDHTQIYTWPLFAPIQCLAEHAPLSPVFFVVSYCTMEEDTGLFDGECITIMYCYCSFVFPSTTVDLLLSWSCGNNLWAQENKWKLFIIKSHCAVLYLAQLNSLIKLI